MRRAVFDVINKSVRARTLDQQILKGLCHEDFAILGQFCAKIITWCLYSYTKCSCETMRKISNEFYQGEPTIISFLEIFETTASKFSSFNPFASLASVATDDKKQFQWCQIVFNNKTRPSDFLNSIDAKTLFSLLKRY